MNEHYYFTVAIPFLIIFIFIIIFSIKKEKERKESIEQIDKFLLEMDFYKKIDEYMNNIFLDPEYRSEIQTSNQIVNRFSYDPVPYLVKYFEMQITEESFNCLIMYKNDLTKIYEFIENDSIKKEYFENLFPRYRMFYVSPQGNSRNEYTFVFDLNNTSHIIKHLEKSIKRINSNKYQRVKLTSSIRQSVLKRDNYTCQKCGNSIYNEPNLLLEIDHIIPISRGGKTEIDNLQTLCWKCNRSKGSDI